jgi:hypothetical protein
MCNICGMTGATHPLDEDKGLCSSCDGCGYTGSDIAATPWSRFVGSNIDELSVQVNGSNVWRRPCTRCKGFGRKRTEDPDTWIS